MVQIRLATKRDLPMMTKVYNQAICMRNVTADIKTITEREMAKKFDSHDTARPLFTIIDAQNQPVGYASLNHFYGRPAYDEATEISIYLDEQTRGQGYGTKVMHLLEQKAKSLNIHYITGYVFAQNIPCNKLFEKQGYTLWGNLPQIAHIDGQRLDLHIWGKQI